MCGIVNMQRKLVLIFVVADLVDFLLMKCTENTTERTIILATQLQDFTVIEPATFKTTHGKQEIKAVKKLKVLLPAVFMEQNKSLKIGSI